VQRRRLEAAGKIGTGGQLLGKRVFSVVFATVDNHPRRAPDSIVLRKSISEKGKAMEER
jgi:hypothetical protein